MCVAIELNPVDWYGDGDREGKYCIIWMMMLGAVYSWWNTTPLKESSSQPVV